MTTPLPADVQHVLDRWAGAELAGDAAALDALLHPQFLFAGPFGFLLERQQWQERFTSGDLRYTAFAFTVDAPTRTLGDTTLVVGTQTQQGTHQGTPVDGRFRGTLVLTRDPQWLISGLHLSLRQPPRSPDGTAGPAGRGSGTLTSSWTTIIRIATGASLPDASPTCSTCG